MQANREGIFLATVGDHSVAPNGPNKLATFIAQYHITDELQSDGSFANVAGENMAIIGYHYLEQTNGAINKFTIDKLKETFGWDGAEPFWLEDSLPADAVAKLTLEFSEHNGKKSLKVKYIDHPDSTGGGVTHVSAAERTAIKNKLSSKLRAVSGGTPAKAPPPPATKPAAPKKTTAKKIAPSTREDAFAAFSRDIKEGTAQDHVNNEWYRVLGAMFPNKPDDQLTPDDWGKVRDEGPGQFISF